MGWGRPGGYRRWKRRKKPPAEIQFDPTKHARAANERGWDWRPRQCSECNHLFVPQFEEHYICDWCIEQLERLVDIGGGV